MKPVQGRKTRNFLNNKRLKEKTFLDLFPLKIRTTIKYVNDAIKTPVISITIIVIYFASLALYTNYRKLDYFDFILGMGPAVWVTGAIFIFIVILYGAYIYSPSIIIFLLKTQNNISYKISFSISMLTSIIAYNILNIYYNGNYSITYIFYYLPLVIIPILTITPLIINNIRRNNAYNFTLLFIYSISGVFVIFTIYLLLVTYEIPLFKYKYSTGHLYVLLFISNLIYVIIEMSIFGIMRSSRENWPVSFFGLMVVFLLLVFPKGAAMGDTILRFLGYGGNVPSQFVGEAGPFCNKRLIKFVEDKTLCTKSGVEDISTVPVNVLLITRTVIYFVDSVKSNDTQPRLGEETARPIVISRRIVSAILPVTDKAKPSP